MKITWFHGGNPAATLVDVGTKRHRRGRDAIIFDQRAPIAATPGTTGTVPAAGAASSARASFPDGRRRRYKVSGRTKQDVVAALKRKHEELDAGLNTSRAYTVQKAVDDWLAHGLPGRADRTRQIYRDALAPLLDRIGTKAVRELAAGDVEAGLTSLSGNLSSRSLQIAHKSLRRAVRYAEANGKVGRNVAALVETPKGRAGRRRRAFTLTQAAALIVQGWAVWWLVRGLGTGSAIMRSNA